MDIESKLRSLRVSSLAATIFALVLAIAGAAQIFFGGMAVSEEYERIEEVEANARQTSFYGYQQQHAALESEYRRSSGAFFTEGRFIPSDERLSLDDPALVTALVMIVAATGFFFSAMAWVWRAHANIAEAGMRPKFGPGKALAAYLVPVANLVLPFEAMRELHNRSHGEGEDFAHAPVEDVTAWWTAVVVGLLVFSAMIVKFAFDAGSVVIIMTPLWMEFSILSFAVILLLASAWLFSGLARKITAAQEEHLPAIVERPAEEGPGPRMSVNIVTS